MMSEPRTRRVLIVTDKVEPTPSLREAVAQRAEAGDVRFRLIVLNPARAELHLLHPERHDKAAEAESVLYESLAQLDQIAHSPVIGSVSVRHDPMDAVEETLFSEPVDEILVDVPPHHLASLLHQDLVHRLAHFKIPVVTIRHEVAPAD
jgi:hypothetical protein